MLLRKKLFITSTAITLLTAVQTANAGFVDNVGLALDSLGFNVAGQRNPLSGGFDFIVNTNFAGNPLDFGASELILEGPISLQISAENRMLPTLEIDFSTALSNLQDATPLSYSLNYDVGPQGTDISGTLLVDGHLSMNGFGFYDLALTYSSRQEVENDGRFSDETKTYDFDLGPINISGNIYADLLAALTDPFFDAAGLLNPFESFSGRAQLDEALRAISDPTGASTNALPMNTFDLPAAHGLSGAVVPEPSVLMLLVLGLPALGRRFLQRNV